MILEGIVTTIDPEGVVNVAPMGPSVDEEGSVDWDRFTLKPFKTSRTYANLKANPEGVLHVTDDVYLLAQAVLGLARPALTPAEAIRGSRLTDCCRYYEFRIEDFDDSGERTRLVARVLHRGRVRDFWGLNRAKSAVLEAAILASRVAILPREQILADFERLRPLVDKTAGANERAAFDLLDRYVREGSVESKP